MARKRRRGGRVKRNIIADIGSAASGTVNAVGGVISGAAQAAGPYAVPIIAGGAAVAVALAANALGIGGGDGGGGAIAPPQEPPRIVYASRDGSGYVQSPPRKKRKLLTTGGNLSAPTGFGKSLDVAEIHTSAESELASGIKKHTVIVKRIKRQMAMGAIGAPAGIGGAPIAGAHGVPPSGLRQAISANYEYLTEEQRRRKFMRSKIKRRR
jgi:hypothetical protein